MTRRRRRRRHVRSTYLCMHGPHEGTGAFCSYNTWPSCIERSRDLIYVPPVAITKSEMVERKREREKRDDCVHESKVVE